MVSMSKDDKLESLQLLIKECSEENSKKGFNDKKINDIAERAVNNYRLSSVG